MADEDSFIPKEQVLDRVPKRIRELQFGILYDTRQDITKT